MSLGIKRDSIRDIIIIEDKVITQTGAVPIQVGSAASQGDRTAIPFDRLNGITKRFAETRRWNDGTGFGLFPSQLLKSRANPVVTISGRFCGL
jgi:hypothetical protein